MSISRFGCPLTFLAALLSAPSAWAQDNIRLAGTYTVSSALPYYVARDKGYFTAENLK